MQNKSKKRLSKRKTVPQVQIYFNKKTLPIMAEIKKLSVDNNLSVSDVGFLMLRAGLPIIKKSITHTVELRQK